MGKQSISFTSGTNRLGKTVSREKVQNLVNQLPTKYSENIDEIRFTNSDVSKLHSTKEVLVGESEVAIVNRLANGKVKIVVSGRHIDIDGISNILPEYQRIEYLAHEFGHIVDYVEEAANQGLPFMGYKKHLDYYHKIMVRSGVIEDFFNKGSHYLKRKEFLPELTRLFMTKPTAFERLNAKLIQLIRSKGVIIEENSIRNIIINMMQRSE